jgi:hypothetical protein
MMHSRFSARQDICYDIAMLVASLKRTLTMAYRQLEQNPYKGA